MGCCPAPCPTTLHVSGPSGRHPAPHSSAPQYVRQADKLGGRPAAHTRGNGRGCKSTGSLSTVGSRTSTSSSSRPLCLAFDITWRDDLNGGAESSCHRRGGPLPAIAAWRHRTHPRLPSTPNSRTRVGNLAPSSRPLGDRMI